MKFARKTCHGRLQSYIPGSHTTYLINHKKVHLPLTPFLTTVAKEAPGTYSLRVSGGGAASRHDVIVGLIYKTVEEKLTLPGYKTLGKPDPRRALPTRYGGGKPSKRYQKSYR